MRQAVSFAVALLFCATLSVHAQVTNGTISGTVTDSTGAVVPGAKIVILNEDTGISRAVQADTGGRYTAPSLTLGNYKVTANLEGFQTQVRSGISLTVGRIAVVDFQLTVGAVSQSVEVSGEAPLVETTQSAVTALVSSATINELPINGRNLSELVLLQPGVSKLENAAVATHRGYGTQINISGARSDDNLFLLDGTDIADYQNNAPVGPNGIMFGAGSIREFQVQTSNISAQYGRTMGGVFNSVSKSGTNSFTGEAFESLRNSAMDARNFFDPAIIPPFRRNQFGGGLGGPIVKNKTFFHLSYEGSRQTKSLTSRPNVPGINLRNGIFPDGHSVPITPVAAAIIPYYPLPTPGGQTFSDGTAEYIIANPTTVGSDFFQTRLDHQISDRDSLFGRFTFLDLSQNQVRANAPPGYGTVTETGSRFFTLSETRIISARDLNTFRAAFNRNTLPETLIAPNIPPLKFFPDSLWPGNFSVTGISLSFSIGLWPYFAANTNRFEVMDDLTLTRGNHSIQLGANFQRAQEYQNFPNIPNGQYNFRTWEGFLLNRSSDLGQFRGTPLTGTDTIRGIRLWYLSGYVQDDWRVRPNLTLNLGVRYDFDSVPTEVNGKISNFRTTVPGGDLAATGQWVVGDPLWQNPTKKNFQPRFGFVWDPFGKGKTSVRGGAGLFYARLDIRDYWANRDGLISKVLAVASPSHFPDATLENSSANTTQVFNTDYHIHTPHDYQWSLNVQQQLSQSTVLSVGYSGNRGNDLISIANFNTPESFFVNGILTVPTGATRRNPRLETMDYTSSQGDSWYNGMTVDLRRRLAAGLQFQLAYTWSKSISTADQTSRAQLTFNRVSGYFLDPAHIDADKSLSPWDSRHVAKFNYVYDLPFGPSRHWLSNGIASRVLGGWQLGGILTLKSGSPFTYEVTAPGTLVGMTFSQVRPIAKPGSPVSGTILGKPNQTCDGRPCLSYYDPNGFLFPGPYQLGNIGRLTGIGPGIGSLDASLQKTFPLTEKLGLQFRVEAFNVTNRSNFGIPNRTVFGTNGRPLGTTGRITDTTVDPRTFQFNLKLAF